MPLAAALCALLLLAAPAAAQSPAAAAPRPADREPRRLLYHLDWGPAPLAEIRVSLSRADSRRILRAEGESLGLARLFADISVEQTLVQHDDGARRFASLARRGGETRRRIVAWPAPGAPPQVDHAGAPPEGPLTPIPEGELADVLDPAAALLALLDQAERGEGCAGTWRIFDGVRRMDLTVIDEGRERLEADRSWTYKGPALRCRLRIARIGGFEADEPRETAETDYDRLLWLARLPGGAAPVRLSVSWPLGRAVGRIDLRESGPALENPAPGALVEGAGGLR